jgi:hypothetical protein
MYNKLPEAWKPYISNIDADYFKWDLIERYKDHPHRDEIANELIQMSILSNEYFNFKNTNELVSVWDVAAEECLKGAMRSLRWAVIMTHWKVIDWLPDFAIWWVKSLLSATKWTLVFIKAIRNDSFKKTSDVSKELFLKFNEHQSKYFELVNKK